MSKERDVAEQILQHIGGKENVVSAEHCATRLRLILKDDSRFDKKQIDLYTVPSHRISTNLLVAW